jgi:hypothetical protein
MVLDDPSGRKLRVGIICAPPIANRAPSIQTAVEYVSGVSGNGCHGDGVGGAVAGKKQLER